MIIAKQYATPLTIILSSALVALVFIQIASATACPTGTRPATADDAAVKNGHIQVGTCYNPNEVGIGQSAEEAKRYIMSIARNLRNSAAPPTQERINKLNDTFAICAAQYFKAYAQQYGPVVVVSAYRDGPNGENARAGRAPNSNHTRGVAMDVNPGGGGSSYETMWKFASDNPQFGVCFPHQNGSANTTGYPDRPHMVLAGIGGSEGGACARQGVTKPCSGTNFVPNPVTQGPPAQQQPYNPAPSAGITNQIRNALAGNQQPTGFSGSVSAQPIPPLPLPAQSQFCVPEYKCSGNTVVFQNSFCAAQVQQTCSGGCVNGACVNASSTNTNTNQNTNTTSTPTDILNHLSGATATTTTIATATPLQLISSLQNQSAIAQNQLTQPAVYVAPNTIATLQPGAQQTFTSPDLNPGAGTYGPTTQSTGVFAILQDMRQAIVTALNYLRPFSPVRYQSGDGHT